MAVKISKEQESATVQSGVVTEHASLAPWWPRQPLELKFAQKAKARVELPLNSKEDVHRRAKLYPEMHEAANVLGSNLGIPYSANMGASSYVWSGYNCVIPRGRVHPDIHSLHIPDELWIFGDNGEWLNPLLPCHISIEDEETRRLFGIEDLKCDILAIPVCSDVAEKEPEEHWHESCCVIQFLTDHQVNALLCIARVPLSEVAALMLACERHGEIKRPFYYEEDGYAVVTWLLAWPILKAPTANCTEEQLVAYRAAYEKLQQQLNRLRPNSYLEKYCEITDEWLKKVQ